MGSVKGVVIMYFSSYLERFSCQPEGANQKINGKHSINPIEQLINSFHKKA